MMVTSEGRKRTRLSQKNAWNLLQFELHKYERYECALLQRTRRRKRANGDGDGINQISHVLLAESDIESIWDELAGSGVKTSCVKGRSLLPLVSAPICGPAPDERDGEDENVGLVENGRDSQVSPMKSPNLMERKTRQAMAFIRAALGVVKTAW